MKQPRHMRRKSAVLAVLLSAPLFASCGNDRPATVSAPPETRAKTVAAPTVPEPTAPCGYDRTQLCNTDKETADVLAGYDEALAEANRRLCWFQVYFGFKLEDRCRP